MNNHSKTLRLHFPQWQGGTLPAYHFGARLLAFLAPQAKGPIEDIPVPSPSDTPLKNESGIVARTMLMQQLKAARAALAKHQPERVVVLGGDCLVDLAPFAYLSQRYGDAFGILWVDAHPDVTTPQYFDHAHAMVLGNLLGHGDDDFRATVPVPVRSENVLLAGLGKTRPEETALIEQYGLQSVGPESLNESSRPVIEWLEKRGIEKLAIHLDLDVIDPAVFRSLYFSDPDAPAHAFDGITQGQMTREAVQRLLSDVGDKVDVVGLGIAEYLPWDALNLSNMLAKLPLLRD